MAEIPFVLATYNKNCVTLSWSTDPLDEGYEVKIFGASGQTLVSQTTLASVSSLQFSTATVPFKTGGIYFAAVRSIRQNLCLSWSDVCEFAVSDLTLPTNVVTYEAGTLFGTIAQPGSDVSVYTFQIQEKAAAAGSDPLPLAEGMVSTKGLPLAISSALTAGKTIQLRSRVWLQNALSDWTDYSEILIVDVPKPSVSVTYENKKIHCVWQPVAQAQGYQLELWSTGSSGALVFQTTITQAPYEVYISEGFLEDQVYLVKLRAFAGSCFSAIDEKEIYTSSLSPVLKALYDRLLASFHATADTTLTIDATVLDTPGAAIITLFNQELECDALLLDDAVTITPDPTNDQVLVTGKCEDGLLGIGLTNLSMAFGTDETKSLILIELTIPTDEGWVFSQTFPSLSSTYLDTFSFQTDDQSVPAFALCSVDHLDKQWQAGLNFQGKINVNGPLVSLATLITSVGSSIFIVGPVVRKNLTLSIVLKGTVPDVTLTFSGVSTFGFVNPAFVFYVKQDIRQKFISLVRWVESDVTLSGISIPLAVRLPDAINGWSVMLTPGKSVPLGNVPSFLGFIVGLDLSALMPEAIRALNCFILTGFMLDFKNDMTTFSSLNLSVDTDTSQGALWPILPCLTFDQLNLQLLVYTTPSNGLNYWASILGIFKLNTTLSLQAQIILPIGTGEWVFTCSSNQPIDSLAVLSSLMNGADLGAYLPSGLKDIGLFELGGLLIAYNPAKNKITRLGIDINSGAPWVIITNQVIINRIGLQVMMLNPFEDTRTLTGQVYGSMTIGQGHILTMVGKVNPVDSWILTIELTPGSVITMTDLAGVVGISEQTIESYLPPQVSCLGSLGLLAFYLEVDLTKAALTNLSFTVGLTQPWMIYQDKVQVTASSVSMSISPASGSDTLSILAYISGTILLGKVSITLDANNDQPNGNWVFRGALDDGSVIVFDDIFNEMGLSNLPVPYAQNFPHAITITTLECDVTPAIPKFYFNAASVFEWDMDFALVTFSVKALAAELTLDNPSGQTQTIYLFKAGGAFIFCGINAALALQITNGDADSILYAELTNDNAKELVIPNLADTLTTNSQQGTPWSALNLPSDFSTFGYVSAKLHVNLTQNTFILFGTSDKFGSIGFLTQKLEGNQWGYFVGLALAENFQFASICSSLSIIDNILTIKRAGFSVSSFNDNSVQKLTASMPEFADVIPLPATANDAPIAPGITIYGTVDFKGDLFGNVLKIIPGLTEDSGITIYAFISQTPGYSIFKASMGTFLLFDAIQFSAINLSYQPQSPTDPTLTNILMLSGTITVIIDDNNHPAFDNHLTIDSRQADFYMETVEAIHSPWAMFNVTLENLKFHLHYDFAQTNTVPPQNTTTVSIELIGTIGFGTPNPQGVYPVVLTGAMVFDNGSPKVCSLSLAKPLTIDDFLTTILPDNLWPTGWLDITFVTGSIYYAQTAGTYFGITYRQGYNVDSTVAIYGYTFIIAVQVLNTGLVFTGQTSSAIDLIFAKITDQAFTGASPALEISTVGNNKKFGFLLGVQLFSENVGTAELVYSITNEQFEGSVTYNGTILGTQNPTIKFAWSGDKGFQIMDMPLSLVSTAYDYAKRLDELSKIFSSGVGCEQLVGMAFDQVMTTEYSVNVVSCSIETTEQKVTIPLKITCTVKIVGQDILSQHVQVPLVIVKPREVSWQGFLECLANSVIASADAIVKDMLTNPDDYAKFIAAAGLEKMLEKTLSSLMCRLVKSDAVKAQSIAEVDAGAAASTTAAAGAEAAAAGAEAAATAAAAAAAGVGAETAVPVIAGIVAGLVGLVAGLLAVFGVEKSDEQKQAEEDQRRAEEAQQRVKTAVETLLKRPLPGIVYNANDSINVSCEPVEGGGNLSYHFVLFKNNNKIDEVAQTGTTHTFTNSQQEPGATYKVTIQVTLTNEGFHYIGEAVGQSITVPAILPPQALTIIQVEKDFSLSWQSGDPQSVSYQVRVTDNNGQILSPQPIVTITGTAAFINGVTLSGGVIYQFKVRAMNQDLSVHSKWSSISMMDSSMEAPQQVTYLLLYKLDRSITLSSTWKNALGADHYVVQLLDANHQAIMPAPSVVISGCSASITCPFFAAGKTIYMRIGSQNQTSTQTVWSQEVAVVLIDLAVPVDLTLLYDLQGENVSAVWQPSPQATSYSFELLDSTQQPVGGVQTGLPQPQAIVVGPTIVFTEQATYQGQASAFGSHAQSDWSAPIAIIVIKLNTPTGLALTFNQDDKAVHATWQTVEKATLYEFKLLDASGALVGTVQSGAACQAAVGGGSIVLEPGRTYRGQVRARTANCLGLWCSLVDIIIPNDPALELAQQLKAQGKNLYQAAEIIAAQLPATLPGILAQDLYDVFQPPLLDPNTLAWGLWFGLVKESDAKPALKGVYPVVSDDVLNQAVAQAYHPTANDLAVKLKADGYTEAQAVDKMVQVLGGASLQTIAGGLSYAGYSLLNSTVALKAKFTLSVLDFATGLRQGFVLDPMFGMLPLASALCYANFDFEDVCGVLRKLYTADWNMDLLAQILDLYNDDSWNLARTDYSQNKTAVQIALDLKQQDPTLPILYLVTLLAAICDLYIPHTSVRGLAIALQAVMYSLSETAGCMRHVYAPVWSFDDYKIAWNAYNE